MSDRCGGCGGWLMPDVDECPTCHRPVSARGQARSLLDAPLGLDVPPLPAAHRRPSLDASSGLDFGLAPLETEELLPEVEAPAPPARPTGPPPIGEEEVVRLAGFGPAPGGIAGTVRYAVHVWQRRQALYLERESLGARLARADRATAEREALTREIELRNRALAAFDGERYRTGSAILGSAFVLVLGTLAWLIVR